MVVGKIVAEFHNHPFAMEHVLLFIYTAHVHSLRRARLPSGRLLFGAKSFGMHCDFGALGKSTLDAKDAMAPYFITSLGPVPILQRLIRVNTLWYCHRSIGVCTAAKYHWGSSASSAVQLIQQLRS